MKQLSPCLAVLLSAVPLLAQAAERPPAEAVRDKLVAELQQQNREYRQARQALIDSDAFRAAQEAGDSAKVDQLLGAVKRLDPKPILDQALAAADRYTGDDRLLLLCWAAVEGAGADVVERVVAEITDQHIQSPRIVHLLENAPVLARSLGIDASAAFLAKVVADSRNPEARAWAMYWQATMLTRGRDVSVENKEKAAAILADAEKLAEGTELADLIRGPRFKQERLQIGLEAPDIVGEDVDGVPFKLSDYRGKVVVLDFWGFW